MLVHAGFMRLRGDQELDGNDVRTLMQQLEEGVLAIGAGLAPDDGAGGALHRGPRFRHPLAVRFHVELLQIGGKARQALVIGNDGARRMPADVAVPDAEQTHQHRQVLQHRRVTEMLVHGMAAIEEAAEILWSDGDHQRQPDGRPDRIASAHPVPESEDAVLGDAEGLDLVDGGGDRGEMRAHLVFAKCCGNPFARRAGIGHRLDGGEGLRRDEEQRRLGLESLQRVGDMRAIDVRHIMQPRSIVIGRQRQRRHGGSKVRAADADVDDIGDLAAADFARKRRHGGEHAH